MIIFSPIFPLEKTSSVEVFDQLLEIIFFHRRLKKCLELFNEPYVKSLLAQKIRPIFPISMSKCSIAPLPQIIELRKLLFANASLGIVVSAVIEKPYTSSVSVESR